MTERSEEFLKAVQRLEVAEARIDGLKLRCDAIQDCTKTHDEQIQDLMGGSQ